MRRSRLTILLYGCVLMIVACQRETITTPASAPKTGTSAAAPAKPQDLSNAKVNQVLALSEAPLEKSLVGASVGKDGLVAAEQLTFAPGQPIYVSMWLKESPSGLQTSTRWFDDKHKEIAIEARPMNGAKTATFALNKKLKPGKYRVMCYWGGNEACDHEFEIVSAKKK